MSRRLTDRGQQRRSQLMEFAASRFAEQGYHPTSVAEIVDGLGVGKGVFYWYFDSKERLFLEILRDAQHSLRRCQQETIGEEPDPVRRIELGLRATLRWFDEHRDLFNLFQFAATEERFAPALRKGQQVAVEDSVRHLREGMDAGRIPDQDPEVLAHLLLGATTQLARAYIHERRAASDDVADALVSFCLGGLLGPADQPLGAR